MIGNNGKNIYLYFEDHMSTGSFCTIEILYGKTCTKVAMKLRNVDVENMVCDSSRYQKRCSKSFSPLFFVLTYHRSSSHSTLPRLSIWLHVTSSSKTFSSFYAAPLQPSKDELQTTCADARHMLSSI